VTVIEVEVVKAVRAPVEPAFVRRVLLRASKVSEVIARLPEDRATVAVRITSAEELRDLNRRYAGDDHSTDVLSFAGEGLHVGDIAISWPAVLEQAAAGGHDPKTELSTLLVHGLLHLLGWDHATPSEEEEMWRLTNAALARRSPGYTPRSGLRHSPRA
jgi:probable rRNA maturation factor